ncbi:MAG: tRNA(Ile)-lysidine synthase [Thermoleophilaceae bacterium]|nr:tRNA(Ile)-lysidine synthase [Thermoleophilaceae bacterium]
MAAGEPLLVMLSGGADSVCLLDVAVKLGARAGALHVNYGLRGAESDADEAHCRVLCRRLGVPLHAERVELPAGGNLQAAARDARYALAERLAEGDYAAAHTRSDQAETVLYRLATSPGRRALLGMAPRRGRLVRPLLEVSREDTRAWCRAAGLEWREDSSNEDPRFARVRIRNEALPALGQRAEAAIAETARQLREDDDEAGGVARELLRRLAGAPVPREHAARILELCERGGTGYVDVPGGQRAVVEYGSVRFTRTRELPAAPAAVELPIPGAARFGDWEVSAGRDGEVALDAAALGDAVLLRSWQAGDRMRPAGLGGTKKLQDLFTDRKVPRERRHAIPVLEAGGEIAWVPGVAVGEEFRPRAGSPTVSVTARPV